MRGEASQRTERRRDAHLYGLKAESVAALLLRLKGYTILARRFVVSGGEIDLIARRGGSIAFVEVKARATLDAAAESVTPRQKQRIAQAAELWLAHFPQPAIRDFRFDAILIAPGKLPRHIPAAFES